MLTTAAECRSRRGCGILRREPNAGKSSEFRFGHGYFYAGTLRYLGFRGVFGVLGDAGVTLSINLRTFKNRMG